MVLAAGTVSLVYVSSNEIQMTSTPATGGTPPYTYQWYYGFAPSFSPVNAIPGATSLNLTWNDAIPDTVYYFAIVVTDSVAATATGYSSAVTSLPPSQNINQFAQAPFLGQLDLRVGGTNVVACQVDVSSPSAIYTGCAVKIVDDNGNVPKVVACTSDSDNVFGFVVYDVKSPVYVVGSRLEVAIQQACMWLYATEAIQRGTQVILDVTSQGAVQASSSGVTGNIIVGYAYDGAAAYGALIRVYLSTPSFDAIS